MAWATVEDVKTVTGKTVDEAAIAIASGTIELATGVIEGARSALSGRDAYWLRQAVCYQAAWLAPHPDYFERENVNSASQDGQSVNYAADGLTLAPLARLAVKKLSWRGTRTIMPTLYRDRPLVTSPLINDEGQPWRPL